MPTHFLNADLDIFSDQDLQCLIDEIGDRAFLLHAGSFCDDFPFLARYEIDNNPDEKTPESLILAFCELIEGLSPASRDLWDSARRRVIDLGYEGIAYRSRAEERISTYALSRMAALGIDLAWTYHPDLPAN